MWTRPGVSAAPEGDRFLPQEAEPLGWTCRLCFLLVFHPSYPVSYFSSSLCTCTHMLTGLTLRVGSSQVCAWALLSFTSPYHLEGKHSVIFIMK